MFDQMKSIGISNMASVRSKTSWPASTNLIIGINDLLAKPFTREAMLASVKTHLAHLLHNEMLADNNGTSIIPGIEFMDAPAHIDLEQQISASKRNSINNGKL